jgi:putative spermidine/putrescine transport system substrate-binding protein
MPAAVPHMSTYARSNATLPDVRRLAVDGDGVELTEERCFLAKVTFRRRGPAECAGAKSWRLGLPRRLALRLVVACAAIYVGAAWGQAKTFEGVTLNVNGFGGDYDRILTETIAKPLKAKYGLTVVYQPSGSSAAVAKLIASRDNPPFDLIMCDSPSMPELIAAVIIEPTTSKDVPSIVRVRPTAREFGDYGIPFSVSSTVVLYNAKHVKQPIMSFAELARPELKGKVAIYNLENTMGILAFLAMAEANGGNVDDVEPGFAALRRLKPNIISTPSSTVSLIQLFEQEEAWAGDLANGQVFALRQAGKPIAMVTPKEGVYSLYSYVSPVKGTKHREAVMAYLTQALSDEAIGGLVQFFRYGPTTDIKLSPELAKDVIAYGPEGMAHIRRVDWVKVARYRGEWLERWNKAMR